MDVYDYEGTFQYAILLPTSRHGPIYVRSVGDRLYILDDRSTVYLFDGETRLQQLDRESAHAQGLDNSWFQAKEARQKIHGTTLVKTDESNRQIAVIPLPQEPNTPHKILRITLYVALMGLYLLLAGRYAKQKQKETQ